MATNKIKGITIEIDGNTRPLQQSLSEVDSKIKGTQSNLKQINRLLKFNPGNMTLLKQKQDEVSQAVQKTKDRLTSLKTAQQQYKNSGKDLNSEAYKALQREIIETDSKLKNLKTQQEKVNYQVSRVGQISTKMKTVGGKLTSVGNALS